MILPYPDPPLRASSFVLRPFREGDFDAARDFSTDQTNSRWVPPLPADDAPGVLQLFEEYRNAGELLHLVIAGAADDDYLGEVMVAVLDQHVGELGCGLVKRARSTGIATDAFRMFVEWSMATLDLRRLQVLVAAENTPALHLAERVGFQREGVLRAYWDHEGSRVDAVMLSMLPADLI